MPWLVRFGVVCVVLLGACGSQQQTPVVIPPRCVSRPVPTLGPVGEAFLVSGLRESRLVLRARGVLCSAEALAGLTSRATLTTVEGQPLDVSVISIARSPTVSGTTLDVTVEVPPLPPGQALLRVFLEPSVAVLDAQVVSPIDRTAESGLDVRSPDCETLALTQAGTRFCTTGNRVTLGRGEFSAVLPGVTHALAVGDVVWMMGRDGGAGDLSRWRDDGDGGLALLERASTRWTALASVTETQAFTDSALWTASGDGGLGEQGLERPPSSTCAPAVLEPTGAWMLSDALVCDAVDGGCAPIQTTAAFRLMPVGFDARRVWLFDTANSGDGATRPFLRTFSRPLQPGATEGPTVLVFDGFQPVELRVPCKVQGERPLVLRGSLGEGLVVMRETNRGLVVERFPDVRFAEVTRDWLIGAPDAGVKRAWSLRR